MIQRKSMRKTHLTDAQAVDDAARRAKKVFAWMMFRLGDEDLAFSRSAEMFGLVESNLRSLVKRKQTLKTVSHPMAVNLAAAERYVDEMCGAIKRAEQENQNRIEELTAAPEPEPDREWETVAA